MTWMLAAQAGGVAHVVATAFGVSARVTSSASAFTIVKDPAAAYLVAQRQR